MNTALQSELLFFISLLNDSLVSLEKHCLDLHTWGSVKLSTENQTIIIPKKYASVHGTTQTTI